jgi:hypothetical protein
MQRRRVRPDRIPLRLASSPLGLQVPVNSKGGGNPLWSVDPLIDQRRSRCRGALALDQVNLLSLYPLEAGRRKTPAQDEIYAKLLEQGQGQPRTRPDFTPSDSGPPGQHQNRPRPRQRSPPTDHFCRKISTSSWQPAKRRNNLRCKCDGISRLGVGTCHSDQRLG